MALFDKAAICTDIHFGEHGDSEQHNRDCLDFLEWFQEQAVENQADCVIFMGDWHHNRIRLENRTAWFSRQGFEILEGIGLPVYWIVGNHETYLKESRDIHSLQHLGRYKHFHLINQITQMDEVVFSPWLVGDEHESLIQRQCRYVFGHFELPFFLMNQVIVKTYEGKGLHGDDFANCQAVYSGHFHKRQLRINRNKIPIYYIGNCFGHNFNDANDVERGMAILKWGETLPEYIAWPDAPTYLRLTMSEFIKQIADNPSTAFSPRATIEVMDDQDIPHEDLAELRSIVPVRKVIFRKPPKEQVVDIEKSEASHYNSLDDMIESKLKSMNYDGKFDPEMLIRLYREV